MSNNQIEKEALEFMQNAEKYKKINQLHKWKDIISLMVKNDAPIVTILDFILLKDTSLDTKYNGKRGTIYSLLFKYIKKLDTTKETNNTIDIESQKTTNNSTKKLTIKEQQIKYNISDEQTEKLITQYGEEFIDRFGLLQANATQGMS